ncbi:hypothetical protein Sjap_006148 [Stephania japonica]|uniref:Secreted protein n=1 Tax=Stephania japonica TaxID=461633 RepID=A0AAP0PLR1_9MAGN
MGCVRLCMFLALLLITRFTTNPSCSSSIYVAAAEKLERQPEASPLRNINGLPTPPSPDPNLKYRVALPPPIGK